jgi:[ribosomal protein S5]-alanine N-acetyltransferase
MDQHIEEKWMISTKRLIIRPFAPSDATDLHEYLSDPAIYRYEPGEPINFDRAVHLSQERSITKGFWAMELADSSKMIGHIYFKQIEPHELRTWELGYIVNPAYQGKGYATEAVAALLKKGFLEENIHRVFAHCNPENFASWKLLDRVGLRREGLLRKNIFFRRGPDGDELWTDTYEYAILDEEACERLEKREA